MLVGYAKDIEMKIRTKAEDLSKPALEEPSHYLTGRNGHILMESPGDHTSRSKRTRRALSQDLPHKTSPESLPVSACLSKSTEVLKRLPSPRLLSQVPRELILLLVLLVLCFLVGF